MSYYNQGPPPGQPYQQSHSPYPQQGSPYPPQGSPYPQQGGYPPPQQPYAPPQGPPPGQYNQGPPPQQGWNQPPPQQGWNQPPPQQGWNQPPPQQNWNQPPPQQGWNQPPPQQGFAPPSGPPPQQGFAPPSGPPPGQHGAPPPGNYGPPPGGPPGQPSEGYIPDAPLVKPQRELEADAKKLREAMKGFGTNEALLIQVLAEVHPRDAKRLKELYQATQKRDLLKDIHSETSGYFREGLEGLVRGPLDQDCHILHEAIVGLGTKESAMNDVLLARSNADINAIKQRYRQLYKRPLETDVKGDLSLKTEQLFDMVMSARRNEDSAPLNQQSTDSDVQNLYLATEGKSTSDQIAVCQIMTSRSNNQIRAIAQAYKQRFRHSFEDVIKRQFSGHMQDALLFIIRAGEDPAKHDADLLEESMKGAGTKDTALVRRVIAIHWDLNRLTQCKGAYRHFHKRELAQRIQGETSGDYERLMVACVETRRKQ